MMRLASTRAAAAALVAMSGVGCGSDSRPVNAPPPRDTTAVAATAPPPQPPPQPPSHSPPPRASRVSPSAAGLKDFRAGLVESQRQIDATLASLRELTNPDTADLRAAYNRYCDQLARMNHHAVELRREADAMRASRDQYFGRWEDRVTQIDNPTIRNSAEARRKRLRDAHEEIITTSGEARDAYGPFMKDLQDIKKFLAADLSGGAIADLKEASKKVQEDGAVVNARIGAVIETLDAVQGDGT